MFSTDAIRLARACARKSVSSVLALQKVRTIGQLENEWGLDKTREVLETQLQLAIRDGDANAIGIFANQLADSYQSLTLDQILDLIIDNMILAIEAAIKYKDPRKRIASLKFDFGGLINPPIEEKDFISAKGNKKSLIQARLEHSSTQTAGNSFFNALFLKRKAISGFEQGKGTDWLDFQGWSVFQECDNDSDAIEKALINDLNQRSKIFPS